MTNIKKKKLVKLINKALGIELCDWQIDYIFSNKLPNGMHLSFPCKGSVGQATKITEAQILRLLFRPDFNSYNSIWICPESALSRKGHEVSMRRIQTLYDIYGDDAYSIDRQKEFITICRIIQSKLDKEGIKTNNVYVGYERFDEQTDSFLVGVSSGIAASYNFDG